MCCNNSPDGTRACNQQEPGRLALGVDNECVSNSRIKDFYETVYECEASDRGVSEDYIKEEYCDIALSSTTDYADRVCDLIENRWRYDTYCDCIAYRKLEKMYGNSDYENIIRDVLQDKFDEDHGTLKYHLEKWNDYYSCGHTFECDITANITDYTTTEQTGSPTTSSPAVSNTPSPSKEDNTSDTKVEISTGSTFFVMMILVILRVV